MRIAVCEDNKTHLQILENYIRKWAQERSQYIEISTFTSAEAFLGHWIDDPAYDIAFLDVQMRGMDGMELAEKIRKYDQKMIIVFVTGMVDYVFRGYNVGALRYLVKPIKRQECEEALDAAQHASRQRKEQIFVIPVETQSVRVFYEDIFYFEIIGHYIEVHTKRSTYRYKKKMEELEQELQEQSFCRCHRSYIVNINHVLLINKDGVELDNGETLAVSRARWKPLNDAFLDFYHKQAK